MSYNPSKPRLRKGMLDEIQQAIRQRRLNTTLLRQINRNTANVRSAVTRTANVTLSDTHNANTKHLTSAEKLFFNTRFQGGVIDLSTTPPGSPTDGDKYLVIATATGDWAGQEDDVATYRLVDDTWYFQTPLEGDILYDQDSNKLYLYTTSWVLLETFIDHDNLLNFASNEHFTEASIDHTNITNIGSNSHATIDTHLAASTTHFTMLDEDDMASDSAAQAASQQSIKAYVDSYAVPQTGFQMYKNADEIEFSDTTGSATNYDIVHKAKYLTTSGGAYSYVIATFTIPSFAMDSANTVDIDLFVGRHVTASDTNFDIIYSAGATDITTTDTTVKSFNIASGASFASAQTTGTTSENFFYIRKTVTDIDLHSDTIFTVFFSFTNLTSDALRIYGVRIILRR